MNQFSNKEIIFRKKWNLFKKSYKIHWQCKINAKKNQFNYKMKIQNTSNYQLKMKELYKKIANYYKKLRVQKILQIKMLKFLKIKIIN